MNFINDFLEALFSDIKVQSSIENFQEFKAKFSASESKAISPTILNSLFTFLQDRDDLHISVTFGESDPVIFNSTLFDFADFTEKLNKEAEYLGDETISIVVTINKKTQNSNCTIYDLECFVNTLKSYDVIQFIQIFSKLINSEPNIKLKIFNLETPFYTSTLSFSSLLSNPLPQNAPKRKEIFESFKSQCHFGNIESFNLIPNDFKLIEKDPKQKDLNTIFDRYSNLLSIIYIFDITSVLNNSLDYKINGYKSLKGISNINNFYKIEFDEYYKIYDWVYTGGNLNDKIGLARNIISLHFKKAGELLLQGNPFQSVKSSFKVYEKQNIKQYIEIRNKISDQLLEFTNRANKIVETFANGFQKSTLALISFYISTIVIRVLSKGDFVNIFSLDATVLSLAFLGGSIIYYSVSRWEIKEQRKRFVSSYSNLKQRYTDLLEVEDIKRIMNNDAEYKEDIEFIDNKTKIYSIMWISIVVLLSTSTIFLFLIYNIKTIFNTIKLIF